MKPGTVDSRSSDQYRSIGPDQAHAYKVVQVLWILKNRPTARVMQGKSIEGPEQWPRSSRPCISRRERVTQTGNGVHHRYASHQSRGDTAVEYWLDRYVMDKIRLESLVCPSQERERRKVFQRVEALPRDRQGYELEAVRRNRRPPSTITGDNDYVGTRSASGTRDWQPMGKKEPVLVDGDYQTHYADRTSGPAGALA